MNRAERRRKKKKKAKMTDKLAKALPGMDRGSIGMRVDYTYDRVRELNDKVILQIQDRLLEVCSQELLKVEQYMMVGDVLIALKALEMTFGELKTVQRGMNKFLQNFTPAMEYIDDHGIAESYREMQERFNLGDLYFDETSGVDAISDVWSNNEQKVSQIIWEVWKDSCKDIDQICEEVKAL